MNISGGNNVEKLNENNYDTWKLQMRSVLIYNDLWGYTSGKIGKPKLEAELDEWENKDSKALALILLSVKENQLGYVNKAKTSLEAWKNLEDVHSPKGPTKKILLYKQLFQMKKTQSQPMTEHICEFQQKVDKLEEARRLNVNQASRGIPRNDADLRFDYPRRQTRSRDVRRMMDFNEERAAQGRWSNQVEVEDKWKDAAMRQQNPKFQRNRPKPIPESKINKNLSIKETPAKDDLMWDGSFSGSKPTSSNSSHNLDFSSFPLLCERVWLSMETDDGRLRRQMPFCLFLHAMTEYLNAYLITISKFQNADSRFENFTDPLRSMRASQYLIPRPIYEYIVNVTKTVTSTGTSVRYNLPTGGTPQGPIFNNQNEQILVSGSFGNCDAEGHNSYECYVSPAIT